MYYYISLNFKEFKYMKKRILVISILFVLLLTVCLSCGGKKAEAGVDKSKIIMKGHAGEIDGKDFDLNVKPARRYTIAIVVKNVTNPFWETHIIAAKQAGTKYNVNILDYAPIKAENLEEQTRILEDLVTAGVDGVILAPAQTEAVRGPVQELVKAKIPVVYDNTMGPTDVDYVTYIGVNNYAIGQLLAEEISNLINKEGNLLILEGVPGQSTSDQRTKGALDYIKQSCPNITVEAAVTNWMFDLGRRASEDYITKWGDKLKGISSVGGNSGEGAIEAVRAAGLLGKVPVGVFDLQEPQYMAVMNGDAAFTVGQGAYEQAYYSVVAMIKALNGESVPQQINTPLTIVNKGNIAKFDERPQTLKANLRYP